MNHRRQLIFSGSLLLSFVLLIGIAWFAIAWRLVLPQDFKKNKAILAASPTLSPAFATPYLNSSLETIQLPITSSEQRTVIIYLPKGYRPNAMGQDRYPVLYLLHGSPGRPTDWPDGAKAKDTLDTLIAEKIIPPTIGVFPDGNGGVLNDTQYINSADGKIPTETFITSTLVNYMDKYYPTRKEARWRAIGGLSSGGFGALNLGLKHQDIYGYILSFSGYGTVEKNVMSARVIQDSQEVIEANSPDQYIENLTVHTIKVWLGTGVKDEFYSKNVSLRDKLQKAHFTVVLAAFPGSHSWPFWTQHLNDGLHWLSHYWRDNQQAIIVPQ